MPDLDPSTWPAWATAPVAIAAPNPAWPMHARALAAEIEPHLAPWLCDDIHHVGSTAVPELPAKPIIDLMAGVDSLDSATAIAPALRDDDWHLVATELDGRPWRRFLVKVDGRRRLAHLHLMQPADPHWGDQFLFRDRLRASAELREEYAELKYRLAEQHPDDREAYTAGKTEFVTRVLALPG